MASLHFRALVCVTFAAAALLQGCKKESAPPAREKALATASTACRESTTAPDPANPELDCAAPPTTFDVTPFFGSNATSPANAGPTFDSWAWASFAAMNWPAKEAAGPTGYLRGIPDLGASFTNAANTDVVVWETFKEKREVFNDTVTASGWQQLTYSPSQTIGGPPPAIPACTSQDQARANALPGGAHRRVLQTAKLSPTLATGPNTLDETAEVASPAQESQSVLCAGYQGTPTYDTCLQLFPPPPGGTANTPYPPTIVNNRPSLGVGPRVYDPGLQNDMQNPNAHIVFYEVRVNYDYFNYVLTNGLNVANAVSPPPPPPAPAVTPPYALPWRTSAQGPPSANPQKSQLTLSPVKYDAQQTVTAYQSGPMTPPPVGSIQVKSAWKFLPAPDPAYHTTEAVYFQTTAGGTPCFSVATFGLIGLHIIQRAHMGNSTMANADPVGGTFIFATWEHNSISNGGGYSYVNFLADSEADQVNPIPYPAVSNAIPITRQQSYPLQTTTAVNNAVYNQLPANSVWRNYRLIGTQFYANVTAQNSEEMYNQPYFLANLVVETNNGLQNFQGIPPNIMPVLKGFPNGIAAYQPGQNNMQFNGTPYNMGGCMGCHGVAQILGSNFSFVLLDGQKGAGIDTPSSISIPP